jgi:hypothetical protein
MAGDGGRRVRRQSKTTIRSRDERMRGIRGEIVNTRRAITLADLGLLGIISGLGMVLLDMTMASQDAHPLHIQPAQSPSEVRRANYEVTRFQYYHYFI